MYKAVLFAPNGDWVTDYRNSATIETVQERLADQGSRWYFYPYHAVITDMKRHGGTTPTQRIVDAAEPFEYMKGKTIRSFGRMLANLPDKVHEQILS